MTRPHEETWMVLPTEFGPWNILSKGCVVAVVGDGCTSRAGADLVAAAPDLARALLDVEWSGRADYVGDGGYICCPSCGGIPDGEYLSLDAREDLASGRAVMGHTPDCKLDGALRKAGVR